jgi:hypothetical protein
VISCDKFSEEAQLFTFALKTVSSWLAEAAHEKTHKDTDNFLVTVGA